MSDQSSKDPLHGVTLEALLTSLVARYGWAELAKIININCFKSDPSIKSSLKFLRRAPWARQKVEELYIDSLADVPAAASVTPAESPWDKWKGKKLSDS
ncbi:VF530 family protein [Hafnia paralvei]|uniref:VF530 family protein n=1 Tax=Hafnia paralvei TaxID=546367 RepID=UPI001F377971|nr:VF530 family protein [Hafnia paralvei]MCE9902036.1 VF530 family protein [Hafnia paralvei]MCE9921328.1 VF530 family protein [Hafnia paralvei]